MKTATLLLALLPALAGAHELTTSGTRFLLDGKPFPYTGLSFFNAVYNQAFNKSTEARTAALQKFRKYGINVLRVWSQWDSKRGFMDACAECSLYHPDGSLRMDRIATLKQIAVDADREGICIELVLFSQESWHDGIRLGPDAATKAIQAVAEAMRPHRNFTFQVWNEFSERVMDHIKTIRATDPRRLVTNSPGYSGVLGDPEQNAAVDYLTPHTSRQNAGRTWDIAPAEIRYLLERWRKPVVDDEPARNGTNKFGGPKERTYPADHIVQITRVWDAGGYITYHHDMFQTGAGTPSVPPSGIPDPEFSPYHRPVFEFIALRERYDPAH
ncbi:MAG: hypothetical protein SGI92_17790 [Bryobacteraceae bacterium]|nr:hypothetical protein [Bryobacteraceae bacterium]